jgi:glycosyltransferase involved in cell wall biosynthesis
LLSEAGLEVDVVTNKFEGETSVSREHNLVVYRLPLFRSWGNLKFSILKRSDVLFSSFLRKLVSRADVIYVPRLWFVALPLMRRWKKPTIVHLHDYIPACSLSTLYNSTKNAICDSRSMCSPKCIYSFERDQGRGILKSSTSTLLNLSFSSLMGRLINSSNVVFCVSERQRQIIVDRLPNLRSKAEVLYNPLPPFSEAKIEGDDFGYFGGLSYMKGFHSLYRAMVHLRANGERRGQVHVTKFPAKLESKALRKLGFLTYGKLGSEDFAKMYSKVKGVIVPSVWNEPWPYVVVEALIKGRFVLASRIGGISEQVKGCKGAMLFEPGDFEGLANGIEFVENLTRDEMIDYGSQNRETYLSTFNNDSTVRKFINVCEKLVGV